MKGLLVLICLVVGCFFDVNSQSLTRTKRQIDSIKTVEKTFKDYYDALPDLRLTVICDDSTLGVEYGISRQLKDELQKILPWPAYEFYEIKSYRFVADITRKPFIGFFKYKYLYEVHFKKKNNALHPSWMTIDQMKARLK